MELLWYFLAGFCIWNSIPHLVKGITGQTHMTPFKRVSSPMLNIVWSFVNFIFGLFFLGLVGGSNMFAWPWEVNLMGMNMWAFLLGALAVSLSAAKLFGGPNPRLPWHKD